MPLTWTWQKSFFSIDSGVMLRNTFLEEIQLADGVESDYNESLFDVVEGQVMCNAAFAFDLLMSALLQLSTRP